MQKTISHSKTKTVNKVRNRLFTNNTVTNVESINWRADWKKFSGVSCASVLKVQIQQRSISSSIKVLPDSKPNKCSVTVRTSPKHGQNRVIVNKNASLTKKSDVPCHIRRNKVSNTKICKAFTPSNHGAIHLKKRFNSNIATCDENEKDHSEHSVNVVNRNRNTNNTGTNKFGVRMQSFVMDDNNDKGKPKCTQNLYE